MRRRVGWGLGFLLLALAGLAAVDAQARVVVETLHSTALRGNAIGDSPDRAITVYLPPSYDAQATRRYPVVYLLHGATSEPGEWFDGSYQGMDLGAALDRMAGPGEFIVVMPAANNRYGGSFYVNSARFGRWEDFVAKELVAFVDARFRTQPERRARGLAGQSMGGFGALYLAGRHPDTFAYVYAVSPCCLGFVGDLAQAGARWRQPLGGWLRAMAMAFAAPGNTAPEAEPPLPFTATPDGGVERHAAVEATWKRYMPLYRLERDPAGYRRLCGIAFDAGLQDQITSVTAGARAFSQALDRHGIAHAFATYDGTHTDHTRERFETAMLPFFARAFASAAAPKACAL